MKSITMLCSLIFLVFFQINVSAQTSNTVQLSKGQVCDVKVGREINELLHDGERVTVEKYSGEDEAVLVFHVPISNCGIVKVYASGERLKIFQVETDNNKFSTSLGGRVGMTLEELKSLYPKVKLNYPQINSKNFSFGFYLPNEEGHFDFDANHIRVKCEQDYDTCKREFDNLRAVSFVTY
ncbi:hypothetical protein [Pseudemcibacter aquimaris]|uniref:hypothetical protein n=1 Tax=Pseudemcibacter aquimaris TaxID=2857064 RepID=UPI002011DA2E|nr:hypothetical protein [Pseudemcibacter aquimaris]MCC3859864.1 hypothetical protein [Pseudemcibacter aquimaris]WDU57196.1 hypothetical protein KW060_08295 [Pseudemcibacter aquimaris]